MARSTPRLEHARALRAEFARASYTVDALESLWGAVASAALARDDRVPARRALGHARADQGPLAVLASLFVLGDDIPKEDADGVVDVDLLESAGLIERTGGSLRASVDLRPYTFVDESGVGHWWICSDRGESATGPLPEDHVLGVGRASMSLTRIMVQTPVRRALDLGTGCGIQALHASRFATSVVATDLSERAIAFARFTAALNDVDSIDFRVGDLFEPVGDERFDLIVSNPPFVITPRTADVPEYVYRDGGREGDDLTRAVVDGCVRRLNPGGMAQLLGNWEYHSDQAGLDRVIGWIDAARDAGAGVDALVVERTVQDPAEYAETWVRDGGTRPGTPEHAQLVGAWLDDFERRGVVAVGFGFLALRAASRRPGATVVQTAHDAGAPGESWSGAVLAALDASARVADIDDDALLASHPVVAQDVTEQRSYWPGAEDPSVIELRKGGGWIESVRVDSAEAALVGACDGELSVDAIVCAIAQLLDADVGALRAATLPRVRELIRLGFLTV